MVEAALDGEPLLPALRAGEGFDAFDQAVQRWQAGAINGLVLRESDRFQLAQLPEVELPPRLSVMKDKDIETKYIFGFTEGSGIGIEGEKEVSVDTVGRFGSRSAAILPRPDPGSLRDSAARSASSKASSSRPRTTSSNRRRRRSSRRTSSTRSGRTGGR